MKKTFFMIFLSIFFASCSSLSTKRSIASVDQYVENNLNSDDMLDKLFQDGKISNREDYDVHGFLRGEGRKAKSNYEKGNRLSEYDFKMLSKYSRKLKSFWTVREYEHHVCFKLSHVSPQLLKAIALSNYWCVSS